MQQLANALCSEKLCESSKIRIFWPRERCSLLRDDVVFVDSPGVDVSPNLDDWIDNHCLDADVFVLVLNAESTMTLAVSVIFEFIAIFATTSKFDIIHSGKIILSHGIEALIKTKYLYFDESMGCISQWAGISGLCKCLLNIYHFVVLIFMYTTCSG